MAADRVHGQQSAVKLDAANDLELQALAMSRSYVEMRRSLEDVERYLGRVQRRLEALLRPRRWRMGDAIAYSLDRIAVRRQEEDPEAGVLLMVREGERLLNRAKERASVNIRTHFLRDVDVHDPVGVYLRQAMTQPTLPAPFSSHGSSVMDFMHAETQRRITATQRRETLPPVTVVMPTYNRAAVITRAVDSVLAQTHEDWELIIIDDGSTDDTAEIIDGYEDNRIRFIPLERNGGVSAARNAGLAQARYDLIAYLDSDNYWEADYLRVVAAAYQDQTDRSCAYTAQTIILESPDGGPPTLTGVRFAPFHRALLENRNYVDLNCFSHRKTLLDNLGGFDTSLPRLVDWELVLRYTRDHRPLAIPCLLSNYVFGAVDDQLTHRYPFKEATKQLDHALFGPESVRVDLPSDTRRVHRQALLRPGPQPSRTTLSRPVSVVVIDEGRGWVASCLRVLLKSQPDLDPVKLLTDGPALGLEKLTSGLSTDPLIATAGIPFDQVIDRLELDGQTDLLLVSSDAVVMPGAVGELQVAVADDSGIGLAIPRRTILPGTDSYPAHLDHYKLDRELDIALSSAHRNVVDPYLDEARGYVEISYSPIFCAMIAASVAPGLLVGVPLTSADGALSQRLSESVRFAFRQRVAYVPTAKTYHLI